MKVGQAPNWGYSAKEKNCKRNNMEAAFHLYRAFGLLAITADKMDMSI
jgi:hypothetical protein